MTSEKIDIKDLDKADVLAVLYNASKPQKMGFMAYDPEPMTRESAQKLLDAGHTYFDYLKGRVMKIDLSDDELDTWGYDRDNGQGAAKNAILSLRNTRDTNSASIIDTHRSETYKEAEETKKLMHTQKLSEKTYIQEEEGRPTLANLGLNDVSDSLSPKVDGAIKKLDDLKE